MRCFPVVEGFSILFNWVLRVLNSVRLNTRAHKTNRHTSLCKLIETNIKSIKNLVLFGYFFTSVLIHILVYNITTAIIKKHFGAFVHWVNQF